MYVYNFIIDDIYLIDSLDNIILKVKPINDDRKNSILEEELFSSIEEFKKIGFKNKIDVKQPISRFSKW